MTKALIVGGGIAGHAAAIALHKAGIAATVFEAYDRPADDAGLLLNVASTGRDALRAVDIDVTTRRRVSHPAHADVERQRATARRGRQRMPQAAGSRSGASATATRHSSSSIVVAAASSAWFGWKLPSAATHCRIGMLSCGTDGRGAYVVLTGEGLRAIRKAAPGHVASVHRHFIDLLPPEQIRTLGDIAETVVSRLPHPRDLV